MREIILAGCVRTAIGNYNGVFKGTPATDLGAAAIRDSLLRSAIDPNTIGSVVMGNVIQAGNGMNPARQAAIGSGLPVSVPAQTVNRVCGSGAQAIISAAQEVQLGLHHVAIAGGMENMDRAPYLVDGGRWGYRMGNATMLDSMLRDGLNDAFSGEHSGWHTEDLVTRCQISRDDQDRWAERSQKRFAAASEAGLFDREIVAVTIKGRKGDETITRDETPRPETSMATLSKLRPAFRKDGSITAGNSPGLNSAASAMLVADRAFAEDSGIEPMARLVSYGVAAVEPGYFGLGPVPAIQIALIRAGWTLSDVDRFEINEAFAAVPLAVMKELGLPEDIVNVDGGAIAHGHAIGATGAILTTRLLHAMRRDGARRGVVTLCIGGGQGVALAFEAIEGSS
ncbi:thiolase family protein [Neorhizobium lilium]